VSCIFFSICFSHVLCVLWSSCFFCLQLHVCKLLVFSYIFLVISQLDEMIPNSSYSAVLEMLEASSFIIAQYLQTGAVPGPWCGKPPPKLVGCLLFGCELQVFHHGPIAAPRHLV